MTRRLLTLGLAAVLLAFLPPADAREAKAPPLPGAPYPTAATTGWKHTGVSLRTVKLGDTGPGWSVEQVGSNVTFYVRASVVIDSLNIPFCVKVLANDVTFTRSRIACASYYTVNTSDPPVHYSGLTLTDVELYGLKSKAAQGIAVMGTADATYTRLNVHGFASSGPRLASGDLLQDSYVHGFVCQLPDHSAAISANDGGTDISIIHNRLVIETTDAGCASTALGIDQDFGEYDGVTISNNLLNGGAYCMYTAQNQGSVNVHVTGNTFGRQFRPECGVYGPVAQVASGNGNTFTGNVWGGGLKATSSHAIGDPVIP